MGSSQFNKIFGLFTVTAVFTAELEAVAIEDQTPVEDDGVEISGANRERRVADDAIVLRPLREGDDREFLIPILLNERGWIYFYCVGQAKAIRLMSSASSDLQGDLEFRLYPRPRHLVSFDYSNYVIVDRLEDLLFPSELLGFELSIPPQESGGFLVAKFADHGGHEKYFGALVQGSNRCGTYIGNSADETGARPGADSALPPVRMSSSGGCQQNAASVPQEMSSSVMILLLVLGFALRKVVAR